MPTRVAPGVGVVVAALAIIFFVNHSSGASYPFQVGSPGPGQQAPPMNLAATTGGRVSQSSERGRTVLLFFEEGVGCEPCWTQIKDIQSHWRQFRALGIAKLITITGDPLSALRTKVADEGIGSPVLSDPGLAVSQLYGANQYGMMGGSADGHSFLVVGPDGAVKWRADYGGPPSYIMDVPVPNLIAGLRKGLSVAG